MIHTQKMDRELEQKVLGLCRFWIEKDYEGLMIEEVLDPKEYHEKCERILEYEIFYHDKTGFWYSPTIK